MFAVPTYFYIVMVVAPRRLRPVRELHRRHRDDPVRPGAGRRRAPAVRRHAHAVPAAQGLLVRRRRADRHRGHLRRRAGVQEAGVQERGQDAGLDGGHPRHPVLRRVGAGPPPPPVPEPRADRLLPDGPAGVRRGAALPRAPDRHRGDPHAGGQHRLRRLPPALVDHRPGRVPAPPAREPGRPARVLQRRARARRCRRRS